MAVDDDVIPPAPGNEPLTRDDPAPDPAPSPDPAPTPAPTGDKPAADTPAEEHFIDVATLPEELKSHWKRMHGTYNKKLAEIRTVRARQADLDFLDQYRASPDNARRILEAEAARLGLRFAPAAADQPARTDTNGHGTGTGQAPPQLVEAIKARLTPELQWMAESLANGQWAGYTALEAPRQAREREQEQARLAEAWDKEVSTLSEAHPGWEAREDDMIDLNAFLKSKALSHPRWGSRAAMLYRLVTGTEAGTAQALTRMAEAAKGRTTTGTPGRSAVPDSQDRVRKARNNREAAQIAAEEAEKMLGIGAAAWQSAEV